MSGFEFLEFFYTRSLFDASEDLPRRTFLGHEGTNLAPKEDFRVLEKDSKKNTKKGHATKDKSDR